MSESVSHSLKEDPEDIQGAFALHELDNSVAISDGTSVYTVQALLSYLRAFLENPSTKPFFENEHLVVLSQRRDPAHSEFQRGGNSFGRSRGYGYEGEDGGRGGFRGYGGRGHSDRGFSDRGFGSRGYGDRGYGSRGYGDRGYGDRGGRGQGSYGGYRGDSGGDSYGSRDMSYSGRHRSRNFGSGMKRASAGVGMDSEKRMELNEYGSSSYASEAAGDNQDKSRARNFEGEDRRGRGRGGRFQGSDGMRGDGEGMADRGGQRGGRGGRSAAAPRAEPVEPENLDDEQLRKQNMAEAPKEFHQVIELGAKYELILDQKAIESIESAETRAQKETVVRNCAFASHTIAKKFISDYLELRENDASAKA